MAYVVGCDGRLLAHSDPERHLGADFSELPQVKAGDEGGRPLTFGEDPDRCSVLTGLLPRSPTSIAANNAHGSGHRPDRRARRAAGRGGASGIFPTLPSGRARVPLESDLHNRLRMLAVRDGADRTDRDCSNAYSALLKPR